MCKGVPFVEKNGLVAAPRSDTFSKHLRLKKWPFICTDKWPFRSSGCDTIFEYGTEKN